MSDESELLAFVLVAAFVVAFAPPIAFALKGRDFSPAVYALLLVWL